MVQFPAEVFLLSPQNVMSLRTRHSNPGFRCPDKPDKIGTAGPGLD